MSFMFGGQPKVSSAEKINAAETEVEMISDMFNRQALSSSLHLHVDPAGNTKLTVMHPRTCVVDIHPTVMIISCQHAVGMVVVVISSVTSEIYGDGA